MKLHTIRIHNIKSLIGTHVLNLDERFGASECRYALPGVPSTIIVLRGGGDGDVAVDISLPALVHRPAEEAAPFAKGFAGAAGGASTAFIDRPRTQVGPSARLWV